MNASLPVRAEPVYEAELVDDAPAVPGHASSRSLWHRSRFVPVALKSRQALKQAVRDALVWLVRSPFTFAGAVGRGVVVCVRAWRRWVRVHDYREAAEQAEKLADSSSRFAR